MTDLILTLNTNHLPGNSSIYQATIGGTGELEKLVSFPNTAIEDYPALSGAVVCDGVYHAVYADVDTGHTGVFTYDLSQSDSGVETVASSSLFHAIGCGDSEAEIVGVASYFDASISDVAVFGLKRLNLDTGEETLVAAFPTDQYYWTGYDNIFSFSDDGKEIWASFPTDMTLGSGGRPGGVLYRMDTSTGDLLGTYSFPHGPGNGQPYHVVPGDVGETLHGALFFGKDDTLFWCDLSINDDNEIEVTRTSEVQDQLWSGSQPQTKCGGNVVTLSCDAGDTPTQLTTLDSATGAVIDELRLTIEPETIWGGIACLS